MYLTFCDSRKHKVRKAYLKFCDYRKVYLTFCDSRKRNIRKVYLKFGVLENVGKCTLNVVIQVNADEEVVPLIVCFK